jgi:uncharacterized protein (TIGR02599 family)
MFISPALPGSRGKAFTLIELLVSMVILTLILFVVLSVTTETTKLWRNSSAKIESFQNARLAFETITRSLSHASLNTYYDYYNNAYQSHTQVAAGDASNGTSNLSGFVPFTYGRNSDLEFVSGKALLTTPVQVTHSVFFQTPSGYTSPGNTSTYGSLGNLLNSVGFYVDFDNNLADRPAFLSSLPNSPPIRYRYRLMEFLQPTESFSLYGTTFPDPLHSWFTGAVTSNSFLLAENILALIILPRLPTDQLGTSTLTNNYEYDSQTTWTGGTQPVAMNQLPPIVHVVLIAADEPSMARVQGTSTTAPNLGFSYNQLFQSCGSGQLDSDLGTVSNALTQKHINFRIFSTDVVIEGAKWSN